MRHLSNATALIYSPTCPAWRVTIRLNKTGEERITHIRARDEREARATFKKFAEVLAVERLR